MSDKQLAYIAGIGMITPVGANAEMTAAAVKAGISSYEEVDFFDDDFNKIKMSCVPQELLDDSLIEDKIKGDLPPRQARMLQLSKLALAQMNTIPKDTKLPLFLACPENGNACDHQIVKTFMQNIASQTAIDLDLENSRIISTGRAGGLDAINLAMRYLEIADIDYALVGAVDTYYEKQVIDFFLKSDRLQIDNSIDGFVPGEAAAYILLSKNQQHNSVDTWPCILEPGTDQEQGHLYSDQTYTGSGLATAVTKSLSHSGFANINTIYSSMNGENYFAKELGVMIIRNNSSFDEEFDLLHPADCFGDLGAAIGIVMIGIACDSLQKGESTSPCLICCSSDSASRSAAIVSV